MKSLSSQRRPLRNCSTTYFILQLPPIPLTLIQRRSIQTNSRCPIIRMQLRARQYVIWTTLIPTTVCSSLSIAFLGTKTVMPDLLIPLPYHLRPWKWYTTSYRKSSCSYVHLLLRTLSRMTFLSWMTSSESTLLSWRLN